MRFRRICQRIKLWRREWQKNTESDFAMILHLFLLNNITSNNVNK